MVGENEPFTAGNGRGGVAREAVLGNNGVTHNFHGEIPEEPLRETICACEAKH
jgi:hypothetical protein